MQLMQRNYIRQRNATQRNYIRQRNATQRNAMQCNKQRNKQRNATI